MGVGGADYDGLSAFYAVHAADEGQTAALRRLVDEDERAVVLTFSNGCREGLCQIF